MRLIDADALQEEYVRLSGKELSLIEDAPTVDPVKHGHWMTDMGGCWCSVCNEYSDYSTDYCPNCGAKMDEVEHEAGKC